MSDLRIDPVFDADPVMARRTRERVVQELDGAEVGAAHFPGLQLGRLLVTQRPRQWLVPLKD